MPGSIDIISQKGLHAYLAIDPAMEDVEIPGPGAGIGGLYRSLRNPHSDNSHPTQNPPRFESVSPSGQYISNDETDNSPDSGIPVLIPSPNSGEQQTTRTEKSEKIERKDEKNDLIHYRLLPIPEENQFRESHNTAESASSAENQHVISVGKLLPPVEKMQGFIDDKIKTVLKKKKDHSYIASNSGSIDRKTDSGKKFTGFPADLEPTPKQAFRTNAPDIYRGIYINNYTVFTPDRLNSLIKKSQKYKINSLVIDVQPKLPDSKMIKEISSKGFYPIARIVVFDGGLKEYPPDPEHIGRILDLAGRCAEIGFEEIQLDYIRFSDNLNGVKLSLKQRYRLISGILKMATDRVRPHKVRVGADIFGRVAFNQNDMIGQNLELFATHLDTIYPMLYPSHFYGQSHRIRDPYGTIFEGIKNSMKRVNGRSRIIAYIQGFNMKVSPSGLSLVGYIQKQIEAVEKAGGGGYIVWNSSNDYDAFFEAQARLVDKLSSN